MSIINSSTPSVKPDPPGIHGKELLNKSEVQKFQQVEIKDPPGARLNTARAEIRKPISEGFNASKIFPKEIQIPNQRLASKPNEQTGTYTVGLNDQRSNYSNDDAGGKKVGFSQEVQVKEYELSNEERAFKKDT